LHKRARARSFFAPAAHKDTHTHISILNPQTPKTKTKSNERRAFLDPYAQFARFSDGNGALLLDEFLDAKETVADLSAEYEACERPDYVRL
jgi:hypothetical protein